MHWNIRGIVDKVDAILVITANNGNISVIGICEQWINRNDLATVVFPGFKPASVYGRLSGIRGGTAIFLSEELEFDEPLGILLKCPQLQSVRCRLCIFTDLM